MLFLLIESVLNEKLSICIHL